MEGTYSPLEYINTERSQAALEETVVAQMLAAGKDADQMAVKHAQFLKVVYRRAKLGSCTLFQAFRALGIDRLRSAMRFCKLGKYRDLGEGFMQLAESGIDLRTCPLEELERVRGIGLKTSRFFVMGTREGVRHAILDTHVLRFMRDELGIPTPKTTPTDPKKYYSLERAWLDHCDSIGRNDVAQYDLEIWAKYSGRDGAARRG
jgi:hypothetical protein